WADGLVPLLDEFRRHRRLIDNDLAVLVAARRVVIDQRPEVYGATGTENQPVVLLILFRDEWTKHLLGEAPRWLQELVCGREPCGRIAGEHSRYPALVGGEVS